MNPYLNPQNQPHLKLEVFLDAWSSVDCLIDTGFSGGIALPESYLSGFKHSPSVYQEFELADGSYTTFAVYQTKVKFEKIVKDSTLFFTKSSEGLVGIEFLTGFKFTLDLKMSLVKLEQP
ncbi:hypothetical protein HYS82_01060 [Candidatus Amesbacteria bacterium]|nr:hypothetical protein [Candidatus Amesbacteria bacterium]MBI2587293.1 hypothetical protein [Candidatus Amesbacteria bacterium]